MLAAQYTKRCLRKSDRWVIENLSAPILHILRALIKNMITIFKNLNFKTPYYVPQVERITKNVVNFWCWRIFVHFVPIRLSVFFAHPPHQKLPISSNSNVISCTRRWMASGLIRAWRGLEKVMIILVDSIDINSRFLLLLRSTILAPDRLWTYGRWL